MKQNTETDRFFNEGEWGLIMGRFDLTPRERQVAELLLQDIRHREAARRLGIRPGTVKTHTRNIYRKVAVKNLIQLLLKFKKAAGG